MKTTDPIIDNLKKVYQTTDAPTPSSDWTARVMRAIREDAVIPLPTARETITGLWPLTWAAAGIAALLLGCFWTGWLEPDSGLAWLYINDPILMKSWMWCL